MVQSIKHPEKSGIILLAVLWMLVILSVMAIGLARRTAIDLSLTKYYLGKLQARYAARGGVVYARLLLKKDAVSGETAKADTLWLCGVDLEGRSPQEIFDSQKVGPGSFTIGFTSWSSEENKNKKHYGFTDEDGRLNLNAINRGNYSIAVRFFMLAGVEEERARIIAASIADWIDQDSFVSVADYGAEDDYYENLPQPYRCKNRPFDTIEELMLVRGMTEDIFNEVKDAITIFPRHPARLTVNINTARPLVMRALFMDKSGPQTNTDVTDAESLAKKIINFRNGPDAMPYTEDDKAVDINAIGLNAKEKAIYFSVASQLKKTSRYFRVHITGWGFYHKSSFSVEVVLDRLDGRVLEWKEF